MVTVPLRSTILVPSASATRTVNVSVGSSIESPTTDVWIIASVAPAGMVSVPRIEV